MMLVSIAAARIILQMIAQRNIKVITQKKLRKVNPRGTANSAIVDLIRVGVAHFMKMCIVFKEKAKINIIIQLEHWSMNCGISHLKKMIMRKPHNLLLTFV